MMSIVNEMITKKFQPGQELEKNDQGIHYPIQLPTQKGKADIGYTGKIKKGTPLQEDPIPIV